MSGTNIFNSGSDKKSDDQFKEKVDVQSKAILTVTQRQKDLESSVDIINEKLEMLDHNSVSNYKKVNTDLKNIRDEIHDIKEEVRKIQEFNAKVVKQIKMMAGSDEVAKLEKYIDLWNPMDFVTREELEKSNKQTVEVLREIVGSFLTEDKAKSKVNNKEDKNN
jgi:BMFP domain-containing protein YqiC